MEKENFTIRTGSKIAIVGGGPAGSFFALYLLRFAQERGIKPEITIYQERDFNKPGPKGCKGCAGILSTSFFKNLNELSLTISGQIIQSQIEHYAVHTAYTSISISSPEKDTPIMSVYRGGGPRISQFENHISFDNWLLGEAEKRGAGVKCRRVDRIYPGETAGVEVEGEKLEYDLVVLASGVNARPVPVIGTGYVPPETRTMPQDELYVGAAQVESRLGNTAHVFLIQRSGLIFGTLVPKGPFINVSVLSSSKHPVSVADFLGHEMVREILPEHYERACSCQPRTVVGPARNYYADRFVAAGDAAITRLYKDGIGSSLLTARQAAYTAINHGVSRNNFKQYYEPFYNTIKSDNVWGRLLFAINDRAKNSRVFLLAQHRLISDEQQNAASPQPFTRAAWGMFTGSYQYSNIARMTLTPASLIKFSVACLWEPIRITLQEVTLAGQI